MTNVATLKPLSRTRGPSIQHMTPNQQAYIPVLTRVVDVVLVGSHITQRDSSSSMRICESSAESCGVCSCSRRSTGTAAEQSSISQY